MNSYYYVWIVLHTFLLPTSHISNKKPILIFKTFECKYCNGMTNLTRFKDQHCYWLIAHYLHYWSQYCPVVAICSAGFMLVFIYFTSDHNFYTVQYTKFDYRTCPQQWRQDSLLPQSSECAWVLGQLFCYQKQQSVQKRHCSCSKVVSCVWWDS